MANIKKNFNFRNGVQVDDDNLLVTDTGLVGIGTTIPNEALDVRGNIVVTGFTSSSTAQIGVLTVTTFVPNQIVGAGLSVLSGIVTAQGAGILTYFGDARNLQGMPTSQWEDKDVGLGFTSIYNTGGNVGVGTEDPRSTFQVGNNADAGEKGVGISSVGNINMTGIITASSFVGNVTGDVAGRITGDVVGNINSAGVSTFITLDVNGDVDFDGHTHIDNMSVSGVSTFASNIVAQGNLDLTGELDVDGGATIDNIQIGITNDNEIDTSTGNLILDSASGTVVVSDNFITNGSNTLGSALQSNTTYINSTTAAHSNANTLVGVLEILDDEGGTHILQLDTTKVDNSLYLIKGDSLFTATSFNYIADLFHVVKVRAIDNTNQFFEKDIIISLYERPEAPTSVSLISNVISTTAANSSFVGQLQTADVNGGSFNYSFVSGANDNQYYKIQC